MSYDTYFKKYLSFPGVPAVQIPSIWNDEDEWLTSPHSPSGLSISEDDSKIYIDASMPGIDPKFIEVTFHDGYLWVTGEVKEEENDKMRKYYRKAAKSFSYRVAVPGDIDANSEPTANYKHGVMKVAFQKSPKVQPKKITVKFDASSEK